MRFDVIAFDADDTLWHNERLYEETQAALAELVAPYGIKSSALEQGLYATETRNIQYFGYGIKSFTLSMIETVVELSQGKVHGQDILAIIALGKKQLRAPVDLFDHAVEAVAALAAKYPLMLVTKGDLLDQEDKLRRSGLGIYFHNIEVVSDKTQERYARLLQSHRLVPERVLMVGDSLRSDILPVLGLGCWAVHIPYQVVWKHEAADMPTLGTPRFCQLKHLGELPALLDQMEAE